MKTLFLTVTFCLLCSAMALAADFAGTYTIIDDSYDIGKVIITKEADKYKLKIYAVSTKETNGNMYNPGVCFNGTGRVHGDKLVVTSDNGKVILDASINNNGMLSFANPVYKTTDAAKSLLCGYQSANLDVLIGTEFKKN